MSPPFPVELYEAIFRFLDHPDLAAVARTSTSTGPIALRVLYRVLRVAPSPPHAPPSVVLTLSTRPDIARHVRHFTIALDHSAALFHSFYRRLATALSSMSALVSLDIFIDAGSWVLPDNRVYPQLQHFASSFPFDSRVAAFFTNAPVLESAQVESAASPLPSLAQASLLRLAEFTGCSSAAAAVVPGRPVESIHINSGDVTEDMVPALAKSTAMVTVLSLTTSSAPVPLLQVLGQHLPHIMYLRITSNCNLPAPPTSIFYEQVAGALAFFPNLQSFELSGMCWSSSKKPDEPQRVWQSQPFTTDFVSQDDAELHLDLYSNTADFFFS
ncbi:hypothetical protein B0H17DRAFT_925885 [Mycena rosella]|uniref:F-box domain-containing protein n=1 Tax=Mycena rosella TaxID=1033263 RepID=A0AAD7DWW6_MYCRO|nr:hypothetical protein B0H17DRAFT_925885 [Mycena rosella]